MDVEGWGEYRKLILKELERLSNGQQSMDRKIDDMRSAEMAFRNAEIGRVTTEIALLKQELRFKAGLWGAVTGAVPSLIAAVVWFLTKG